MNTVSETALITLKARSVETRRSSPILDDPLSCEMVEHFKTLALPVMQQRLLERKPPAALSSYIALRARKYDADAALFLDENPSGLVVSLGAGFDTRFWRINANPDRYIEFDLPEVVEVKKEILAGNLPYRMIGCSVLEKDWIDLVARIQKDSILFLAEGLLMYLPEKEVIRLIGSLASTFVNSRLVFEVVHKNYTRGFRKKMVESKMKRKSGTGAGASYQFGVKHGEEIESYADNLELEEEWSYFEDPEIRPGFLRLLRLFKTFSRTQWTITARII